MDEIEEIVDESVDYLEKNEDDSYELFFYTALTEQALPDTSKAIKNFVLKTHKVIADSNTKMRLICIPKINSRILEPDILNKYINYLEDEKECLKLIKKILKSKKDEGYMNSFCGIILYALRDIHLKNTTKLANTINTSNSGFEVELPPERINPSNTELVKKIGTSLNKYFYNKK